jgi:hypothetical protein
MWLFSVACLSDLLSGQEERYLLTFKAYPHHERKERNLYDLVPRIVSLVGSFRESEGIEAVVSETEAGRPDDVRYGVRSIVRVKVLNRSNSDQSPKSSHNGVYVLVYDGVYTICAKSYSIADGKINYDDYESGKHYEFPIYHRRRMAIYEVQVVSQNLLKLDEETKRTLVRPRR